MLVSGSILQNVVEKYNKTQLRKERFSTSGVIEKGTTALTLLIAAAFFLLEVLVLFFAISTAISCTKSGPERIVNVILAITFTIPYMALNLLFNECTKNALRNNSFKIMGK
jgi:hypothetical protein